MPENVCGVSDANVLEVSEALEGVGQGGPMTPACSKRGPTHRKGPYRGWLRNPK